MTGKSPLSTWTVDYGQGPQNVTIPHTWNQDVPVEWEGPALYRARLTNGVPGYLVFHGVSYEAQVEVDGQVVTHRGLWDAFSVPVEPGDREIIVRVTKNGGERFPVRDVASGFLPFVFHTFGGIYRDVTFVPGNDDPLGSPKPAASGYRVEGCRILAPQKPVVPAAKDQAAEWLRKRQESQLGLEPASAPVQGESPYLYLKGILSWGWYPEGGHPNIPSEMIDREIKLVKSLGFNTIKFCLWVPSHDFLERMDKAGLHAWLELPLWDPTADSDLQDAMLEELRRIVRQYRHHPNIAVWTAGCELHESTSAAYRQRLVDMIREEGITSPIKDNSGSAEMYGGDLREFGDFYDFHPYADTHYYPSVLGSLTLGSRQPKPTLLGEFNDYDVYRDFLQLEHHIPFWASADQDLNAQGCRWQYDLPGILTDRKYEPDLAKQKALIDSSVLKGSFIRRRVQEHVRSMPDVAGYVITGLRDTPISTSGFFDDGNAQRYSKADVAGWNGEQCLFIIPSRRPPWVDGGNRPGWIDPFNAFEGRCHWRIGLHSEFPIEGELSWDITHFTWTDGRRPHGRVASGTCPEVSVGERPLEVGEISWMPEETGGYVLRVQFGNATNFWPIWIVPTYDPHFLENVEALGSKDCPSALVGDRWQIVFSHGEAKPMWRECCFSYENSRFWTHLSMQDHFERFLPISTSSVVGALPAGFHGETCLQRVDTRTLRRDPYLLVGDVDGLPTAVTSLMPFGGSGSCPMGLSRNPAGWWLVRQLAAWLVSKD